LRTRGCLRTTLHFSDSGLEAASGQQSIFLITDSRLPQQHCVFIIKDLRLPPDNIAYFWLQTRGCHQTTLIISGCGLKAASGQHWVFSDYGLEAASGQH
jgi:hypothetical protein